MTVIGHNNTQESALVHSHELEMGDSYPQPYPGYTFSKLSPPPRDLVPIYPAEHLTFPTLPTPPRSKPSFDAPYVLTTHLIPSAYLRTRWNAPVPAMPQAKTKEERKKVLKEIYEILLDNCSCSGQSDGHPRLFWNCLNRYVRKGLDESSSTGITLFFAHATGIPKEVRAESLFFMLR